MPTYSGRMSRKLSQAPRLSIIMAGEEVIERKVSAKDFICSHVKTIATLIMIFATLLCIILIVMVHKWKYDTERAERIHACLDVAVIGGGLSGSYAAWRLRDTQQRVALLETSDRIGGRLYTWRPFDQVHVHGELGAMFYLPQQHPLLNHTIHALKLTPVAFHPPNQDPPMLYLRGQSLTLRDLNLEVQRTLPYHLKSDERWRNPKNLRTFYLEKLLSNGTNLHTHPLYAADKNGRSLYTQGYWNMLSKVASYEGILMLSDTSPWRSLSSNGNAALLASVQLEPNVGLYTIDEGMDALPQRLMDQFLAANDKHEVIKNKRLGCIIKEDGYYNMIFVHTNTKDDITTDYRESSTVCAKKVIMALPPPSARKIKWKKFTPGIHDDDKYYQLQQRLDTIDSVPGIVAYFVYGKKWWTEYNEPWKQDIITDLPVKRVRYVGEMRHDPEMANAEGKNPQYDNEASKHLFMVANLDGSDYAYYSSLVTTIVHNGFLKIMCDNSSHFIQDVTRSLALIYGVKTKDIPPPDSVYIVDWAMSPSGGARFMWKTGVLWDSVAPKLQRPRDSEDVFIVGDAYCPGSCQLWAEGALNSVERVLQDYHDVFFS